MQENERCRIHEECVAKDGPAVDGSLGERSHRKHLLVDDGCSQVKEHSPHLFMVERAHPVVKDGFCGLGIGDVLRYLHDLIFGIMEAG